MVNTSDFRERLVITVLPEVARFTIEACGQMQALAASEPSVVIPEWANNREKLNEAIAVSAVGIADAVIRKMAEAEKPEKPSRSWRLDARLSTHELVDSAGNRLAAVWESGGEFEWRVYTVGHRNIHGKSRTLGKAKELIDSELLELEKA